MTDPVRREDVAVIKKAHVEWLINEFSKRHFKGRETAMEHALGILTSALSAPPSAEPTRLHLTPDADAAHHALDSMYSESVTGDKYMEAYELVSHFIRAAGAPSLSETTKDQAQPDLALQEREKPTDLNAALKALNHTFEAYEEYGNQEALDDLAEAIENLNDVADAMTASPQVQQSEPEARLIAESIWKDITNRKGVRQAIEQINEDIQEEIKTEWTLIIRTAIRSALPSPPTKED